MNPETKTTYLVLDSLYKINDYEEEVYEIIRRRVKNMSIDSLGVIIKHIHYATQYDPFLFAEYVNHGRHISANYKQYMPSIIGVTKAEISNRSDINKCAAMLAISDGVFFIEITGFSIDSSERLAGYGSTVGQDYYCFTGRVMHIFKGAQFANSAIDPETGAQYQEIRFKTRQDIKLINNHTLEDAINRDIIGEFDSSGVRISSNPYYISTYGETYTFSIGMRIILFASILNTDKTANYVYYHLHPNNYLHDGGGILVVDEDVVNDKYHLLNSVQYINIEDAIDMIEQAKVAITQY
ncbi:MAG: hypothetical protein HY962_06090 [Ignavibacteriae bacterium]|nr:hypothetical protein [Ignavibacteriota bacterium]